MQKGDSRTQRITTGNCHPEAKGPIKKKTTGGWGDVGSVTYLDLTACQVRSQGLRGSLWGYEDLLKRQGSVS